MPEMTKKVMKKLKEEVEEKRSKIVAHLEWKGRKEQDDCVLWLLGERAALMQQGRRRAKEETRGQRCRRSLDWKMVS